MVSFTKTDADGLPGVMFTASGVASIVGATVTVTVALSQTVGLDT